MTDRTPPRGYMPFLASYSWVGPLWVVATPTCDDAQTLIRWMEGGDIGDIERFDFRRDPFGERDRIGKIYLVRDGDYETPWRAAVDDAWTHANRWYGGEPGEDAPDYDLLPKGFTIYVEAHFGRECLWLYRSDGTCVCGKVDGTDLRTGLRCYIEKAQAEASTL